MKKLSPSPLSSSPPSGLLRLDRLSTISETDPDISCSCSVISAVKSEKDEPARPVKARSKRIVHCKKSDRNCFTIILRDDFVAQMYN